MCRSLGPGVRGLELDTPVLSAFFYCNEIPEIINLERKKICFGVAMEVPIQD